MLGTEMECIDSLSLRTLPRIPSFTATRLKGPPRFLKTTNRRRSYRKQNFGRKQRRRKSKVSKISRYTLSSLYPMSLKGKM